MSVRSGIRMSTKASAREPLHAFMVCILAAFALISIWAVRADASLVRPIEGSGDIAGIMDVYERVRGDDVVDLVLIFAVPNRELAFREEWGGGLQGLVEVAASALQPDGRVVERSLEMAVTVSSIQDASSPTLYQIFTLVLEGIDAPYCELNCILTDVHGSRRIDSQKNKPTPPQCVLKGDWVRAQPVRDSVGLHLYAPLFLSGAPLGPLPEALGEIPLDRRGSVAAHLHPTRRYGLEQSHLQVVFDVEARRRDAKARDILPKHLLVQVLSRELDLAYRDTIRVAEDIDEFLIAGSRATISWRMSVDDLPPGSYQLSCAPLDGLGGSWIAEFDVLWSMQALVTPRAELELIGHLVFRGNDLERFRNYGPIEREAMLGRFWDENDPDPSTLINEAEVEYMDRMRYVRHQLGGFGKRSTLDDRGRIYLLLGPPDEVEKQVIPANSDSFEDALAKVYDAYRPLRYGLTDKPTIDAGVQPIQADREQLARTGSFEKFKAFELWSYKENGRSLFPNPYEGTDVSQRFLFLARLSGNVFTLETSSVNDRGGSSE